jgi:hypothetical protein
MVAVPSATALTMPASLTMAVAGSLLVQAIAWLAVAAGATVMTRVAVLPTERDSAAMFRLAPVMVAAPDLTVTSQLALWPPSTVAAVMVAVPSATALTTPVSLTVAVAGSLLVQAIAEFAALAGAAVAIRVAVLPTERDSAAVFRLTPVTAAAPAVTVTSQLVW